MCRMEIRDEQQRMCRMEIRGEQERMCRMEIRDEQERMCRSDRECAGSRSEIDRACAGQGVYVN